jgi:organic radical activating enzyme
MLYKLKKGKIVTKCVEYSVSYHCNLRCSCCSHMSPYVTNKFPSLESFSNDVAGLSKVLYAHNFHLLGGEPLLNPDINSFIRIARESGIAGKITVITNGLLLHKMDDGFWKNVDYVRVYLYPSVLNEVKKSVDLIEARAKASNTELRFWEKSIFRTTVTTKPQPRDWITRMTFKTCRNVHLYHCNMLHEGKLYKCAVPPFLPEYLSRMGISSYNPADDAFDLHDSNDTFRGLKEFLFSSETMEACRFCLGHLGKIQHHHQLKAALIANPGLQNMTRETHLDYHKLIKESLGYYCRRLYEKIAKKRLW